MRGRVFHRAKLIHTGWKAIPILLAFNYFAFRVELFRDEDEQNHPGPPDGNGQASFLPSTDNWEAFDKDNAPKAIVVTFDGHPKFVGFIFPPIVLPQEFCRPFQPVRDKSPPSSLSS